MKHIRRFEINEGKNTINKFRNLYGEIPLSKEDSVGILKGILKSNKLNYNLGDDINIDDFKDKDQVKLKDYFTKLLSSKTTRGDNFEGLIAGLYNGNVAKRGQGYNVKINNKSWRINFIDNKFKAIELGKHKDTIKSFELDKLIKSKGGLYKAFKSGDNESKEEIFNTIFSQVTGGWIIAYPSNDKISMYIIEKEEMKEILMSGLTTSPKSGSKSQYNLALSPKFKNKKLKKSYIYISDIEEDDLEYFRLTAEESKWVRSIFGNYGFKIRPNIVKYMMKNSEKIADRLLRYNNLK